ncbi:KTSC domain-containing protein [Thermoflexus hugenholtzii]
METGQWVEYDPETDALRLRWRESPDLSIRLEVRGGEGTLSIAPLRKWRPLLEALGLPLEAERLPSGWIGVDSSMISAVRYHPEEGILEVAFNKGVYLYYGVPPEVFAGLLRAESKGRYMRAHVIDRYPWIKKSRLLARQRTDASRKPEESPSA